MGLLRYFSKPSAVRRLERCLKQGRYEEVAKLSRSVHIPAPLRAEAQYKLQIYDAVSSASFSPQFRNKIASVANGLHHEPTIKRLPGPEQSAVRLARVAVALKTGNFESALDKATGIRNKETRSQAIRRVAGHMVCGDPSLDKLIRVITTIPIAAHANEVLRNLLLSKILLKDFVAAREVLPHIAQDIRRSLRPQINFVENNLNSLKQAQKRARGLIHHDDISLTLALVAGAMGKYDWMSKFSMSVSSPLLVGTQATYSASLAYAGKQLEAIALLENLKEDPQEYFLRLGYLAFNVPFNGTENQILEETFANAEHYEGALGYWYHHILECLVSHDDSGACGAIHAIRNNNLRKALATLIAAFAYSVGRA